MVDRQGEARDGRNVIAVIGDELRPMKVEKKDRKAFLADGEKKIGITGREHVYIWGAVTWILRRG